MDNKEINLEQYKMMVNSAEKNSDKRITQNNIYLTINLAFLSFVLTQQMKLSLLVITSFVGIVVCIIWYLTIINYAKRNKVKYDIINEIENQKGFNNFYSEEWKRIEILTPLSFYEKLISLMFMFIYVLITILKFI